MSEMNSHAAQLLDFASASLADDCARGYRNRFAINHFGEVTRLLGREDLTAIAELEFSKIPASEWWSNVLTNIELPNPPGSSSRHIAAYEEVQRDYPPLDLNGC